MAQRAAGSAVPAFARGCTSSAAAEAEDQVKGRLLLYVVVRKGAPIERTGRGSKRESFGAGAHPSSSCLPAKINRC